jgi:hypothetical protein
MAVKVVTPQRVLLMRGDKVAWLEDAVEAYVQEILKNPANDDAVTVLDLAQDFAAWLTDCYAPESAKVRKVR